MDGLRKDLSNGNFQCGDLIFKADFGHIRWTIDTKDDLKLISNLLERLPENYSWLDALSLVTMDPRLLSIVPHANQLTNYIGKGHYSS